MSEEGGFINSDSLTKWARWLIYMQIFIGLVSIVSNNMEYRLLQDYENGVYTSRSQAIQDGDKNDQRQRIIGIISVIVSIISAIIILKWIYRANYNSSQLGAQKMEFTPGWSIGWYFIPIFSLWMPYRAMKEIWQTSHNPANWTSVKTETILPAWWFFWLIHKFLGQAVMRTSFSGSGISELKDASVVYQAYDVSAIFLSFITLALINRIYQAQKNHSKYHNPQSYLA